MKSQISILRIIVVFFMFASANIYSQVGIGTTNPQGALDISSADGGLVLPRINLTSVSDLLTCINPMGGSPAAGTVVYNLGANIAAGFYVFNGLTWQSMLDTNTFLGSTNQTLTANRTIDFSSYNLNLNVANNGSNGLHFDTDYLAFSRDAGNNGDGLMSTRGGMAFNIDSNNNNSNDNEYYSWGHNGAPNDGTGGSNYNELMRLDDTGLGIGTANPETKIHVVESVANTNVAKFQSPEFPMFAGFIIEDTGGNNTARFAITPGNIANNSSAALAGVNASNTNGRNSVTFDVEGSTYDVYAFMEGVIRPGFDNLTSLGTANHRFTDIYLVNNPSVTSDVRLKDNIEETTYGLDTVMQITPVSYELKSDETNEVHLGFKAQQIQELIPEIVNVGEESGVLSMAYAEMIPVLTKAIQDLNNKLDNVIAENNTLRAENQSIRGEIAQQD